MISQKIVTWCLMQRQATGNFQVVQKQANLNCTSRYLNLILAESKNDTGTFH